LCLRTLSLLAYPSQPFSFSSLASFPSYNFLFSYSSIFFLWGGGAFAKLLKSTINFVMSVCPSVCLHETGRLARDGFL
jgi:hypothetical protein